jgi:hypothetical protein
VEMTGLEPVTPCLQSRCSSQLSYIPWELFRPSTDLYRSHFEIHHVTRTIVDPIADRRRRNRKVVVARRLRQTSLMGPWTRLR